MQIRFREPTLYEQTDWMDEDRFMSELRKSVGWTQERMAKHLGVSTILISMIEGGQKTLSKKMLELISQKFNTRLEALF